MTLQGAKNNLAMYLADYLNTELERAKTTSDPIQAHMLQNGIEAFEGGASHHGFQYEVTVRKAE